MENQYQMHFIGNNEPSRPIMKDSGKCFSSNRLDSSKKKLNIPPTSGLTKHNSVPSIIEPKTSTKPIKKQKSTSKQKASNYRSNSDNDDFFASSALMRNGDYAMARDTWQKIEMNSKKKKAPSPMIAISNSGISSENDLILGDDDKYFSAASNWDNNDSGFVRRLLSNNKK